MIEETVDINTADGQMETFVCRPERGGPYPAVFFLMDAHGIREELQDMARRLATVGYYVLLPNLYYRAGRDTILPVPSMTRWRRCRWSKNCKACSNRPAWPVRSRCTPECITASPFRSAGVMTGRRQSAIGSGFWRSIGVCRTPRNDVGQIFGCRRTHALRPSGLL